MVVCHVLNSSEDLYDNVNIGRSFRRVIIPKEPPGFNYVGVVLGPQGSNQRRMQEEYGCRIRIKDEGEEKEFPDAHVAIEGDSPEGVERVRNTLRYKEM